MQHAPLTTIEQQISDCLRQAELSLQIGETKLALRYMERVDRLRLFAQQHIESVLTSIERGEGV